MPGLTPWGGESGERKRSRRGRGGDLWGVSSVHPLPPCTGTDGTVQSCVSCQWDLVLQALMHLLER